MSKTRTPLRAIAIGIGVLALSLLSCGREVTAPADGVGLFRSSLFQVDPKFPVLANGVSAESTVPFERVRVTLRREDGSIAIDTVVVFPVGADFVTLNLSLKLPANTPSSGLPLNLNLGYVNAAGDTVFKGGPFPMTVVPATVAGPPPPPVQIPVQYTGLGSGATRVAITPTSANGVAGQTATFTAQAFGSSGAIIPGTPIVFSSTNPAVVRINNAGSGSATYVGRGTAKVVAQLLTGPSDEATVSVTLPAAKLELINGGSQSAPAGNELGQMVKVRVAASDGIGVGGVTVGFAVNLGGSVSPTSAVSDADGMISVLWTLGDTPGPQEMTVTSAGLTGSPLKVPATALVIPPTQLAITAAPTTGVAGATLGSMTVTALDAAGRLVPTFEGSITATLSANPGGATLSGVPTATAVRGVATFTGLSLNKSGAGYQFTFSSGTLKTATTAGITISAGAATTLEMDALPATVTAGSAITPAVVVRARDALGNLATGFNGSVALTIGNNAGGATLGGTTSLNANAGVATFSNVTLDKVGSGYTLVATTAGPLTRTSTAFTVVPGAPATLEVLSGKDQVATIGASLAPIKVRLLDKSNNTVGGATIALAVTVGGGTLGAASVITDASGVASIDWKLGLASGTQSITATVTGMPVVTLNATAMPAPAARLAVDGGDAQTGPVGEPLPNDLVARAFDSFGNPVKGVVVNWTVPAGGGTVNPTSSTTDAEGRARTTLSFATTPWKIVVNASSPPLNAVAFSATAVAGPATSLVLVSGGNQSGGISASLASPVIAKLIDQYGNPVIGANITYSATDGGTATPSKCSTDASGRCSTTWKLGTVVGLQTLTVAFLGVNPLLVKATAVNTGGGGGDLIVLDDINWGDNSYGLGGSYPGNRQFAKNLVNFTAPGPRASATKLLNINDNTSYNWWGTFTNGWTNLKGIIEGEGYTVQEVSSHSALTPVASDVKVVMLDMPAVAFTTAEINGLKTFASEGGRIIFIGENGGYYSYRTLENNFLANMGSSVIANGACDAPGEIVTSATHQLTTGISATGSNGFYMNCASYFTGLGATDTWLFKASSGNVVGAVLSFSYTLLSSDQPPPAMRMMRTLDTTVPVTLPGNWPTDGSAPRRP